MSALTGGAAEGATRSLWAACASDVAEETKPTGERKNARTTPRQQAPDRPPVVDVGRREVAFDRQADADSAVAVLQQANERAEWYADRSGDLVGAGGRPVRHLTSVIRARRVPSSCPAVAATTASAERLPRRSPARPRAEVRRQARQAQVVDPRLHGKAGFRLECLGPAVTASTVSSSRPPAAPGCAAGSVVSRSSRASVKGEGGVDGGADRVVAQGDPPTVQQCDAPDPQHRQVGRRPGPRGRTGFLRARLGQRARAERHLTRHRYVEPAQRQRVCA